MSANLRRPLYNGAWRRVVGSEIVSAALNVFGGVEEMSFKIEFIG